MNCNEIKRIITDNLSATCKDFEVLVMPEIDSTNDEIKRRASCQNEGFTVIALSQTKGRGRRGRSFFSPGGNSLYMSILLKPQSDINSIINVTSAAAVSVYDAILQTCGIDTDIKWVNDIYLNGRKVCGILTEAVLSNSINNEAMTQYVVLGIGINVFKPKESIPDDIKDKYGTIYDENTSDASLIACLAANTVNSFFGYYANLNKKEYMDTYRSRSMLIGKYATYLSGNEMRRVFVNDIDNDAHLIVTDENGQKMSLCDGEITFVNLEK